MVLDQGFRVVSVPEEAILEDHAPAYGRTHGGHRAARNRNRCNLSMSINGFGGRSEGPDTAPWRVRVLARCWLLAGVGFRPFVGGIGAAGICVGGFLSGRLFVIDDVDVATVGFGLGAEQSRQQALLFGGHGGSFPRVGGLGEEGY